MENINFHKPKNQFPLVEISFLLKRLLLPNFKVFNKALLKKTIPFLLDRNFNNPLAKRILLILKNTISPRQKTILQLLFLLLETIIEIRKNPVCKNNLLSASGN